MVPKASGTEAKPGIQGSLGLTPATVPPHLPNSSLPILLCSIGTALITVPNTVLVWASVSLLTLFPLPGTSCVCYFHLQCSPQASTLSIEDLLFSPASCSITHAGQLLGGLLWAPPAPSACPNAMPGALVELLSPRGYEHLQGSNQTWFLRCHIPSP